MREKAGMELWKRHQEICTWKAVGALKSATHRLGCCRQCSHGDGLDFGRSGRAGLGPGPPWESAPQHP